MPPADQQPQPQPAPTAPVPQVPPAPAATAQAPQPTVKPTNTNYAAAIFFTLLIVGFTFSLPGLLYIPIVFFCVMAGVLFFKDTLASKNTYQPVPGQPDLYYAAPQKRSVISRVLFAIFATIGVIAILFVGFIVFVFIALGSSGGFG